MPTNIPIPQTSAGGSLYWPAVLRTNSTETLLALDSPYSYETSGDCLGIQFTVGNSGTMTDLQVNVRSYVGSPTELNWEIRKGLRANYWPGDTATYGAAVGSGTIDLTGSPTGWVAATVSSPPSLVTGTIYFLIIGDANGSGSDYANLVVEVGTTTSYGAIAPFEFRMTSANGFSTAGTTLAAGGAAVFMKIAGCDYCQTGPCTTGVISSSTLERGMRFKLPAPMTLVGVWDNQDTGNFWGSDNSYWKLYAAPDVGAPNPGGTVLAQQATVDSISGSGSTLATHMYFDSANHYDCEADVWYRFVYKPVTNITTPRRVDFLDTNATVLPGLLPMAGNCYYTIENGGGTWDDTTTAMNSAVPMFAQTAVTAGGGGGGGRLVGLGGGMIG